jgi:hypothetical protein
MPQPPSYTRGYDFSSFQTNNPDQPLPAVQLEAEFDSIKATVDVILTNLALLQRDDTKLKNQIVTPESFSQDALAVAKASGFGIRGDWAAGTVYAVNDIVNFNSATYLATVAHTAAPAFTTNSANWLLLANAAIDTTSSAVDQFVGTGNQTQFTSSFTYNSNIDVLVFVNGALQTPVDDYSISGTTITFVTAPPAPAIAGRENVILWGPSVTTIQAIANATAQAVIAANEAAAAAGSAANALTSENNAAGSATTAAQEAATATTQAGLATTNGAAQVALATTQAQNSATSATASANAQTASETARDASVVAQGLSETARNQSQTAQAASEAARDSALVHKNDAAASAATATTQAGTSTTQAGNSASSATDASNSATSAATAQTAAEAARDAALAALDSFDDRYLGVKSSSPNLDNDGNALQTGALFFSSTTSSMKVYDGSQWLDAYASLSGALLTTNNLSDLNNAGVARTNLGLAAVAASGAYSDLTGAPGLAAVATSGAYTDLTGTPSIPAALTDLSITDGTNGQALKTDGNGNFSFGDVATSTAFADITGKPTTLSGYGITDGLANNAAGEIAAAGVPLSVNSTNSNSIKIALEDNGTAVGHLGANSTNCLDLRDSGVNERMSLTQNGGQLKLISSGSSAQIRFNQGGTDRNYVYQSSADEIGFLSITGGWNFKVDNSGNATATGNVTAYSDERLKDDIEPIEGALERVSKLQGVEYTRKSTGEREIGFVAQSVIEHEPSLVGVIDTSTDHTDEAFSDLHVMKYQNTTALLLEAIKEQQTQIEEMRAELEALKK